LLAISYDVSFEIVIAMKCWFGGSEPFPRASFSSTAVE
jgi:hypothetical protein